MADDNPPEEAGRKSVEWKGSGTDVAVKYEVIDDYDIWKNDAGEYGEGGMLFLPIGEADEPEYLPAWEGVERQSEESESLPLSVSTASFPEETEEEKAIRLEREKLIELLRSRLNERVTLRRRNQYLNKKLVDHFKKRRMEQVLKEDSRGFEMTSKYLKRLYQFQEYKDNQVAEINQLTLNLNNLSVQTDELEEQLQETLIKFIQRQKEVSLGLAYARTGKKLSEKTIDRLLRRQEKKFEEKGQLKLKYFKLKNLIEEKENQLKKLENLGDGLHIMDYEQLKIDNQNYNDKIEEKEEELVKLRVKTQGNIQNLAMTREKAYALEGDIEILETKFHELETEYNNTREKVGKAKKMRDSLREEYARLKMQSGLLTNERLLLDFEESISKKERIHEILDELKNLIRERKKQQTELSMKLNKQSAKYKKKK